MIQNRIMLAQKVHYQHIEITKILAGSHSLQYLDNLPKDPTDLNRRATTRVKIHGKFGTCCSQWSTSAFRHTSFRSKRIPLSASTFWS